MDLRQLRYLIAIAETGHMGRAAERVHVTQPALSQQMIRLSRELGAPVFERQGRSIRLTAVGTTLLRFAREVEKDLREAYFAIDALRGLERGHVSVGVVQTLNMSLLPATIAELTAAHPGIDVTVHELSGRAIEDGVAEGRLDVGIGFQPPRRRDLDTEPVLREPLTLICRRDHRLAEHQSLEIAALDDTPLALLAKGFVTRRIWDAATRQAGIRVRAQLEADTVSALLATVSRSNYLATVLPLLALTEDDSHQLMQIPLERPTLTRAIALQWRRGSMHSHAADCLADIFRATVRETLPAAFRVQDSHGQEPQP